MRAELLLLEICTTDCLGMVVKYLLYINFCEAKMKQIILTSLALALSFTALPSVEGQTCKFAAVSRKLLISLAFNESRYS